jgi:T-complex protein 1 subunit eta
MDLSAHIRKHALSIAGKQQLIMTAFAKALEIIPRQICDNAGLDSTDILNKLRMKHAKGEKWAGVDVDGADGVRNNMDAFVWEPSLVKTNAISSAAEAACLILSVDETVRNPQSEQVRAIIYICMSLLMLNAFNSNRLDRGHHLALHSGR